MIKLYSLKKKDWSNHIYGSMICIKEYFSPDKERGIKVGELIIGNQSLCDKKHLVPIRLVTNGVEVAPEALKGYVEQYNHKSLKSK